VRASQVNGFSKSGRNKNSEKFLQTVPLPLFGMIRTIGINGIIPLAHDNRLTFPVDSSVWSFMLKNAASGG
jgi:hypothetical protein